jgi:hypothetical protein
MKDTETVVWAIPIVIFLLVLTMEYVESFECPVDVIVFSFEIAVCIWVFGIAPQLEFVLESAVPRRAGGRYKLFCFALVILAG